MRIESNNSNISVGRPWLKSPVSLAVQEQAKQEKLWNKGVEKLRQDLIQLIRDNFYAKEGESQAGKKYSFQTAEEYIEAISRLAPDMLDVIKKVGANISLHAADALSEGEGIVAQALFLYGADRTEVAKRLAAAGERIEEVRQLLNEGARPLETLVSLIYAIDAGWAEGRAIPLLGEYFPVEENQFIQSAQQYREHMHAVAVYGEKSGEFLDRVAIDAAKHGQTAFAASLYPHAKHPEKIVFEGLNYELNRFAKLGTTVPAQEKISGWKLGMIVAQFTAIFSVFISIANWIRHPSNLSAANVRDENDYLEIELKKISRPHVARAA